MNPDAPIAWIDESGSNTAVDPGSYIVSAAVIDPRHADLARELMRGLRLPGQVKLHWRAEQRTRQELITATVTTLPIEHLVVVTYDHAVGVRPERRRRLTMQYLLPELADLGVEHAIVESRGGADDQNDLKMLQNLRTSYRIESPFRLDHQVGRTEPLLWIPDAVCGMTVALRCGDPSFYTSIQHKWHAPRTQALRAQAKRSPHRDQVPLGRTAPDLASWSHRQGHCGEPWK